MPSSAGRRWRAALATLTAGALAGALVVAAPLPAQAKKKPGGTLTVMTQNLYLGADLFPAVEAASKSTTEFLLAAAKVYQEAMASDFPTRAAAFAATVKEQSPDLIGLQEVTNWIAGRKDTGGPALQSQDFLAIVQSALAAEGLNYKVVGVSDNASLGPFPYIDPSKSCGAPTSPLPTEWDCAITMEDRDVILVNADTAGLSYKKKSVKSGQYTQQQQFILKGSGQTISFARGYVYADMTYKGAKFRFANTHLEVGEASAKIQQAQAKEFIKVVKKGAGTVVATGDFNTDAYGNYSAKTYKILTKSYFKDTWNQVGNGKEFSCCQNATLSNTANENTTRIDFVLAHGNAKGKAAELTNMVPFRTSPAPLWESDHAGNVTKVAVK